MPNLYARHLAIFILIATTIGCAEATVPEEEGGGSPVVDMAPDMTASDTPDLPSNNTTPQAVCGDGEVEGDEECDDGNQILSDGCTNECTLPRCGDAIIQMGEQCDDGNADASDGCTASCMLTQCGDGTVQGSEQCDDGNDINDDGCTNTCRTPSCGDGIIQPGEECDDGNDINTDICVTGCKDASCGDGFVGPGEGCDDGNDDDTDGCTNICRTAQCGDGATQMGEECDDGNNDNTDTCTNACESARCGDGITQTGEECDDGNDIATDWCTNTCARPRCGDGVIHQNVEQCDDGNDVDTDACTNACEPAVCGDGIVEAGEEECDDANQDNTDACLTSCQDNTCGDGFVHQGVEQCDDMNTASGDGCSDTCQVESCMADVTLTCGATQSDSLGASGSAQVSNWACFGQAHPGAERIYAFSPPGTGPITVTLTGLTADLDVAILEEVGGECRPSDMAACVATSANGGTADERIDFEAMGGTTYYIVVDGRQLSPSSFTLNVGSDRSHLALNEVGGVGISDNFVEVLNRSACPHSLGNVTIHRKGTCDGSPSVATFSMNTDVEANGVARATEGIVRVGTDTTISTCDTVDTGGSHTILCDGPCDVTGCTNILDYMEADDDTTDSDDPDGPACVTFTPAPVPAINMSSTQSLNRVGFSGSGYQATDWGIGPATGN